MTKEVTKKLTNASYFEPKIRKNKAFYKLCETELQIIPNIVRGKKYESGELSSTFPGQQ